MSGSEDGQVKSWDVSSLAAQAKERDGDGGVLVLKDAEHEFNARLSVSSLFTLMTFLLYVILKVAELTFYSGRSVSSIFTLMAFLL